MTRARALRLNAAGAVPLHQRLLAGAALVGAAPALAIAAILVRATSPGPALFRQARVGINGKPITVIKLRTMRADASSTSTATTENDDRITPTGRWLRRFKIDELPQLWCVIRGDMAIIGPRPDVAAVIDALPDADRRQLLEHHPGITGIASVVFRDEARLLESVPDPDAFSAGPLIRAKSLLNMRYATGATWRDDMRIIALTIRDDPDAVADLIDRLAPNFRHEPWFDALVDQAPDFTARLPPSRAPRHDEPAGRPEHSVTENPGSDAKNQ